MNLTTTNPLAPTMAPTMAPAMPQMNQLFPALVQVFLIIFLGYCAGKWRLVSGDGINGIARYTGTFALPALLFSDMLVLRFDVVDWRFLGAILLSKSLVFFVVLLLTYAILRRRSDNAAAVAGVAAIFSTQSNDFALGLPILTAVYDSHYHPEFIQYVYLLAPISLVFLNPIGFVLLEWSGNRARDTSNSDANGQGRRSLLRMTARVVIGVFSNPIVFMTLLGLIFNLIFQEKPPSWLANVLQSLKASYGATALFLLGLTMVDRIKATFSFDNLLLPSVFILAKLIIMPLVNRNVTTWIMDSVSGSKVTSNATLSEELSLFGFFYGTFPTAPTVFVIANQYGCEREMFASAVVLCTFLSAPLMYVTAWLFMFMSDLSSFILYNETLMSTGVNMSYLSIPLCVLTCVFLLATRRFLRLPHTFTFLLSLAVLKMCVGVVWFPHLDTRDIIHNISWLAGFVSYLLLGGALDARLTAAMLAVSLCLVAADVPKRGRLCLFMAIVCYSVSIAVSVLVVHYRKASLITPTLAFRLGIPQTVSSIVVLLVTVVVISSALIFLVRRLLIRNDARRPSSTSEKHSSPRGYGALPQEDTLETDDDDVGLIREESSAGNDSPASDGGVGVAPTEEEEDDDLRFLRHVVLLFYVLIGAIVALFLCIWRLDIEMSDTKAKVQKLSAAFTLTEFMDYVLNYGQGFVIFALFALDSRIVVLPVIKRIKRTLNAAYCERQTCLASSR